MCNKMHNVMCDSAKAKNKQLELFTWIVACSSVGPNTLNSFSVLVISVLSLTCGDLPNPRNMLINVMRRLGAWEVKVHKRITPNCCYNTIDTSLEAPVLIGVIAEIWVLKSEQVLISESIEATPMYHFCYVRYCYVLACTLPGGSWCS